VADFTKQIHGVIDQVDHEQRQQLMHLLRP
jgi:hypothetical protein